MDKLLRESLYARALRQSGSMEDRSSAPGRGCILVVDDSRTQLFALNRALTSAGYSVLTATNARDGINLAKEHNPDAILMDIVMPGMNGFEATREIRQTSETSHIPVIIISGSDQLSDKVWGMRVGASDYMAKPITRTELLQKLAYLRKQQIQRTADTHDEQLWI